MMKNDIERLLEGKEAVIFDVDGTLTAPRQVS